MHQKGECGKTYWVGATGKQIRRTLEEARRCRHQKLGHEMLTTEKGSIGEDARAAVETHLSGKEFQCSCASPGLKEERGVFVTLLDHVNR